MRVGTVDRKPWILNIFSFKSGILCLKNEAAPERWLISLYLLKASNIRQFTEYLNQGEAEVPNQAITGN